MIPWQPTSHGRIEVRPAYGTIPVAPGRHIVGWEVRVWWPGWSGPQSCRTCRRSPGLHAQTIASASKRPDFQNLAPDLWNAGFVLVPYAHQCSSPVPWATRSVWPSEGWQHPHHHPTLEDGDVYDQGATPILYANAQLAYAAGLELLGIDVPPRMHWKPEFADGTSV